MVFVYIGIKLNVRCKIFILPYSKLTKFVKQNATFDDFDLKSFLNWSDCCDGPM